MMIAAENSHPLIANNARRARLRFAAAMSACTATKKRPKSARPPLSLGCIIVAPWNPVRNPAVKFAVEPFPHAQKAVDYD